MEADRYDSKSMVTLPLRRFIGSSALLLVCVFLLFVLYIITPITSSFNQISFVLLLISVYALACYVALPRSYNSPLVNGFILLPLISFIIIDLPSSLSPRFEEYPINAINSFEFRLKYVLVKVIPALLIIVIYGFKKKKRGTAFLYSINKEILNVSNNRYIILFTKFFLLFSVIYLYSNIRSDLPVISYFSRVFFYAFQWYFFWLGFWNLKLGKMIFYGSIIYLLLFALLTFLTGGRYSAIILVFIFALGYYLSQSKNKRKVLQAQLIWIIPLTIFIVGTVGIVRQEIGRGGYDILKQQGRISVFISAFERATFKFLDNASYRSDVIDEMSDRTKGGGALEKVIMSSPDKIPFRGFQNINREINAIFGIAALQEGFSIEDINRVRSGHVDLHLSTAAANIYGFNVSVRSSVEWPLAADGYSRAGLVGVLIYYFLAITWFSFIIYTIRYCIKNPYVKLLIFTILIKIIYSEVGSNALYSSIRTTILNISLGLFVTLFIFLLSKLNK